MRENPVISDRVPIRGDFAEGSLGGRLAQRLAALRDVMAAGARFVSCLPSCSSALAVPRKSRRRAKDQDQSVEAENKGSNEAPEKPDVGKTGEQRKSQALDAWLLPF
jgi:hypothetical protein